jgi:hypothetical protein
LTRGGYGILSRPEFAMKRHLLLTLTVGMIVAGSGCDRSAPQTPATQSAATQPLATTLPNVERPVTTAPSPTTQPPATAPAGPMVSAEEVVSPPAAPPPRRVHLRGATPGLPPPVEIKLRDVLVQDLPEEVQRVYAGPDGRVWCVLDDRDYGGSDNLAQVKKRIEEQFDSSTPQIAGAKPVLFENNGRVWFAPSHQPGRLLGYGPVGPPTTMPAGTPQSQPGRTAEPRVWIEHEASGQRFDHGTCPNNGRTSTEVYNAQGGGCLFFFDGLGVHVWDGGKWSYQDLVKDKTPASNVGHQARILVAHGSSDALVLVPGNPPTGWRWHDHQWSPLVWPALPPWKIITGAAVSADNIAWVLIGNENWVSFPLANAGARLSKHFYAILQDLGDDSYEVREQATAQLQALGPAARDMIEAELRKPQDAEVKARLEKVLATPQTGPNAGISLGGVHVTAADGLWATSDGTLLCNAHRSNNENPSASGMLIVDPSGQGSFAQGPGIPILHRAQAGGVGFVESDGGRRVWFSDMGNSGVRGLDVASRRWEPPLPISPLYSWVQAVGRDGTLYVSKGRPGGSHSPIAIVQPHRPDSIPCLHAVQQAIFQESGFCVAADGQVWGFNGHALLRFDGHDWHEIAWSGPVGSILGGCDGSILAVTAGDGPAGLIKGDQVLQADSAAQLVEQHPKEVAAALAGWRIPPNPTMRQPEIPVALDRDGHLWVLHAGTVRVRVGEQWLDVSAAIGEFDKAANPARQPEKRFGIRRMAAAGDGSRVYLSSGEGHPDYTLAVLAWVEDGKVRLSPAPVGDWIFHDPAGGLRMTVTEERSNGPNAYTVLGYRAVRVTEKGAVEEYEDVGRPSGLDAEGSVWLTPTIPGTADETCRGLWRPGHEVEREGVRFRGLKYGSFPMASDRPGSVWVLTSDGLQHFTAPDPARRTYFNPGQAYRVLGINEHVLAPQRADRAPMAWSPLGYLVTLDAYTTDAGPPVYLTLIPLPADPGGAATQPAGR